MILFCNAALNSHFSSTEPKVHKVSLKIGTRVGVRACVRPYVRPSVRASTLSNMDISETSRLIEIIFHLEHRCVEIGSEL